MPAWLLSTLVSLGSVLLKLAYEKGRADAFDEVFKFHADQVAKAARARAAAERELAEPGRLRQPDPFRRPDPGP